MLETVRARKVPTRQEIEKYLKDMSNWGRWGDKGGAGAVNLITPEKTLAATKLVKKGRTVSLSFPLPVVPTLENSQPVQFYMKRLPWIDGGGAALDYQGIFCHGFSVTHIDALCHVWDRNGSWDGTNPDDNLTFDGGKYGTVDAWKDGIVTRGVLLDIPKLRGKPCVTLDTPVHGWELEDAARKQGVKVGPGDAVFVYCGREEYAATNDGLYATPPAPYPGLHASCLPFIRENDLAVFSGDMEDAAPNEYGLAFTIHAIIFAFGVAMLDNVSLKRLARVCQEEGRYEFMLTANPLFLEGGTGTALNPVAVF
ncbi:MAG: cyclase family protein [SAR202 cluster bacterium]|nr:cyclase family protein [SAR202 cluster bacterium]